MLRLLVLAIALANAGFFAWTHGWLDQVVGVKADGDREPARLALQVQPDLIRVLNPLQPAAEGTPGAGAGQAASLCLEAGPFSPSQVGPAEAALQTVMPVNRWTSVKTELPPVWIVFMGSYPDRETRQKKIDELRRRNVASEDVRNVPELGDGLSLGRFNDRASAEKAMAELSQRGVRTARVAQLSSAGISFTLRVERVDANLQSQLNGLQGIALLGRAFKACAVSG